LGVSDWGVFSYTISLCGLFMIFSDMGLSSILTRELAKNDKERIKYISTSFSLKILLNAIIFLIILIIAPLLSENNISKDLILIVTVLMISDSIRDFAFSINRSMEKMEAEAFIKIFTNILIVIIAYIFLINSKTVYSLAMGYMIGSLAGVGITLIILKKHIKNLVNNFSKDLVKPLLTIAWPFAFFAILGSIMANTDAVMLGWIIGTEEVGLYATSQRVVTFLYIIPGLITSSLLPTLSRQLNNLEKIKNVVHTSIQIIYLFSIPMIFGGLIIGGDLIIKLFGEQYIGSIDMFKISLLSVLFVFPALVFNNIIFIFNKHSSIIRISFIGAILNIIINILLIPHYGGVGASFATLSSQIVIMLLMKKELENIIELKIFQSLSKIILASIFMSILLIIFKSFEISIYLNILISIIIYIVLLIFLKESSLNKIKTLGIN
jgi:O-antigen/teichoic acid export membrane protein